MIFNESKILQYNHILSYSIYYQTLWNIFCLSPCESPGIPLEKLMQGESCHGWDILHHIGRAAWRCKLRNQRSRRIQLPVASSQVMRGGMTYAAEKTYDGTDRNSDYTTATGKHSQTRVKEVLSHIYKKACFHEILQSNRFKQGSTGGSWTSGSIAGCSGGTSTGTNLGATVVICVGICCGFAAWNSSLEFLATKNGVQKSKWHVEVNTTAPFHLFFSPQLIFDSTIQSHVFFKQK